MHSSALRALSRCALCLAAACFHVAAGAQNNPKPVLSSISPNTAIVNGSAFTLTVNGTNFVKGSKVKWNGVALKTNKVSTQKLTASVPASNLTQVGTFKVTVFNPTPGGGTSA